MYAGIRNLFIELGFFIKEELNTLIVNGDYFDYFVKDVIPLLSIPMFEKEKNRKKPPISIKKLKEILALQEKYGDHAEELVLSYEQSLLLRILYMTKFES